jgi:hypothetical protein
MNASERRRIIKNRMLDVAVAKTALHGKTRLANRFVAVKQADTVAGPSQWKSLELRARVPTHWE